MPQLVKGGKHAFGWTRIGVGGELVLPPDAVAEYGFEEGERLILIPGSRTSGGFGLARVASIDGSPMRAVLEAHPELAGQKWGAGEVVEQDGRVYCSAKLRLGRVSLSPDALAAYGIAIGSKLLVIRGSGRALGFAVRGPILEEANRHLELEVFDASEGQTYGER